KRDDVLYGYPNVLVSYSYPGVNIPPWFAEGVAQFMYPGANYDYWDSHRDMVLRDRVLGGKLLSLAAMNSFGKREAGNEGVYNQGFAFVRYLAQRFGEGVLAELSRLMAGPLSVSVSRALERVTGLSGREIYGEWRAQLEEHYTRTMGNVREAPAAGEVLLHVGSANFHPVWHPDGHSFAFLSNREADYFGQVDLFLYEFDSGKVEKLASSVASAPCWSADGRTLYYAAKSKPGRTGARWLDLFSRDMATKKPQQLTHGERATAPVLIDGGAAVAYLTVSDGTSNIRRLELAGGEISQLTQFAGGEYIHSLTFDSRDSLLLFDATINHGRRLRQLDLVSGEVAAYPMGEFAESDARDPAAGADGLVFSTDAGGVFNLYRREPGGGGGYLTNVPGGAFMPAVNGNGEVLYSLYQDGGYKIAHLVDPGLVDDSLVGVPPDLRGPQPDSPQARPDEALLSRPYAETMSRPFVLPRLMVDYGTVKPGLYFYANEVLDRLLVFGGAGVNRLGDTDFFLLFEFRKFRPTLYAQFYGARRHVRQKFEWYDYQGTDDLRFDLREGIVGGRFPLGANRFWLELALSQYREHVATRLEDLSGGFSFPYFQGAALAARWQRATRRREYGGNMFPSRGYELRAELRGELNKLAEDFAISKKYSTIVTIYDPNNTVRFTVNFKKYVALHRRSRITAAYEAKFGWLSNQTVDDFFVFFGGGSPGLRGYTYYESTAQGPNLMIHTFTLRVPLLFDRNIPLAQLIVQNVTLGLVAQYGDAFAGSWLNHSYKSSAGLELRMNGFNFYVLPFALAYEVHRPLGGDFQMKRQRSHVP
ncbi:MAG: hypothetical protein V3U35_08025, partial [Candidatus Neomarinimicrobiota bacterium]